MKYEEEILKFWEKNNVFEESIKRREGFPYFSFYDGPPFATGKPHYGHILINTIKDTVLRYQTMKGFKVPRRVGWDCHGLPIENLIEKELNIKNKKEIEEFGIDKFNKCCRDSVFTCVEDFEKTLARVGRWADYSNSYSTMDKEYTESVWWVLKKLWDKNLVKKDYRVSPYCPRCSTTLANFEVNQGYKEVKDRSVYIKLKLKDQENTFLLIWTTTPWTLPQNVAVAINSNEDYVVVSIEDSKYILIKKRLEILTEEYKIEKELKGKDLLGLRYEPVFDYLKGVEKAENAFQIVDADFVGGEDGTGLVHIATMYGEDDYNVGKKYDLPFVHTVDESGKFLDFVEDYKGENIFEANKKIIKDLKENNILYKEELVSHTYPFCWRCDSPLMYFAKESYYLMVTKFKDQLIENNKKIHWVPGHIKEGRFGKWLEGARDWDFARNRFWGAPIPIWKCEKCSKMICVGSVEELEKLKIRGETSDLHKPYIDDVYLKCECGGEMERTKEVFDCWFESGSMPYSQWHYPFENKELVEKTFPANFITEGLDQTRGWFYTLHVIATALTLDDIGLGKDQPAFQNVIVNGLVLDKTGRKLSKRLKNYPEVDEIFDKYGADALRYFLLSSTNTGEDYRFSEDRVKEVSRKIILSFENCFIFYNTYKKNSEKVESTNILDKWILSKLFTLDKEMAEYMDKYELTRAVRLFNNFVDDFSNWYIRRSRRRFQKPESDLEFNEAETTLKFVLKEISKTMAPFIPFISEKIYQELKDENDLMSVHLCDFPKLEEKYYNADLEEEMQKAREIVNLALNERIEKGVKVRQPLSLATIKNKINEELLDIIKDEINVKKIVVDPSIKEDVVLDFELTEELKEEGIAREIIRNVQQMRKDLHYSKDDSILLKCEGGDLSQDIKNLILKEVLAKDYIFDEELEIKKELKIYEVPFIIGIKKI
ncbi:MAG: isoleucine--tRNA ligase [Candidatus Pacebacteria bacterium]|nr:isoleucine--tRNA ligase [Candidatus Paceibacterota bacterium]